MCDEVDLVVVDAGCGITAWTRRLWLRAQCVVLVTTADDTKLPAIKLTSLDDGQVETRARRRTGHLIVDA